MPGNPYLGAEDLNETATIQHTGVLFMEGNGEPQEITRLKRELRTTADESRQTGQFLEQAMASSWEMARQQIGNPGLATVLGERHCIIANDWQNASSCTLAAKLIERAVEILDQLDLSTCAVRADLAGPRFIPRYLYSSAELIDRAADLAAESATIVHDYERRWRMFRQQVHRGASGAGHGESTLDTVRQHDEVTRMST